LQREETRRKKKEIQMKKVLFAVALVALVGTAACAKVEDKKPEVRTEAPKVVEETTSTTTTTSIGTASAPATVSTTNTTTTTTAPGTK
jgi:hypothetical protein